MEKVTTIQLESQAVQISMRRERLIRLAEMADEIAEALLGDPTRADALRLAEVLRLRIDALSTEADHVMALITWSKREDERHNQERKG